MIILGLTGYINQSLPIHRPQTSQHICNVPASNGLYRRPCEHVELLLDGEIIGVGAREPKSSKVTLSNCALEKPKSWFGGKERTYGASTG